MSARPALEEAPTQAAVEVEHLSKCFTGRHGGSDVIAIDDVSLRIEAGATLGIVGESGSGKSTLARCLLGLVTADAGHATILGIDTVNRSARDLRLLRRRAQIVFQEPYEALDPRQRVGAAIAEPLKLHQRLRGQQLAKRVDELMRLVVLDPTLRARFPHQLSGGQQQRVNIARALANDPDLLVLDEPTSSLDVSVRSEILGLLVTLQQRLGMTYVLVSHDIATIRAMCTHVAVMYLGRIVEHGEAQHVLAAPSHPYTRYLLGSVLSLVPDERTEIDALPAANVADNQPGRRGCCFATRCPIRVEECSTVTPALVERGSETRVACHLAGDER